MQDQSSKFRVGNRSDENMNNSNKLPVGHYVQKFWYKFTLNCWVCGLARLDQPQPHFLHVGPHNGNLIHADFQLDRLLHRISLLACL